MPRSDTAATAATARARREEAQRAQPDAVPTLSALTGVRSGKQSYYRELRRTEERMTSAVEALQGISAALVRTRDDPRALLEEVIRAAAGHLRSGWTMVALRDGALPGTDVRFLAVGPDGSVVVTETTLPDWFSAELRRVQITSDPGPAVDVDGWVRVPLVLDRRLLGSLVGRHLPGHVVEHEDLWVLRILANQAAVSMHTATLYATGADLRRRAQLLYDEIELSSTRLQNRTAELQQAEGRLRALSQRELLDAERHRIALELHDSVAQYVLSAGLAVDLCRSEAVDRGGAATELVGRLITARDLIAQAGDQVRSVIYALHHEPESEEAVSLPELLQGLAAQHSPILSVSVRVEGRPVALGQAVEHALARIAGEALFNVSIHAVATRAIVRLRYTSAEVSLWISDDGDGDPTTLRRLLRVEARGDSDGRHRGLANMAQRAVDLNGTFAIRRSKLGGVRLDVRVPISPTGTGHDGHDGHDREGGS